MKPNDGGDTSDDSDVHNDSDVPDNNDIPDEGETPDDRRAESDERNATNDGTDERIDTSRRRVLYGTAIAGVSLGAGVLGGRRQQQPTTYRFGARVSGWQGRAPPSISGTTNPTLELQAGQQYRVVWENLDGQPHNFVVTNAAGESIVRTQIMSEQGATQTVTFTARPEMARYVCEVHPNTMVGDVSISGGMGNANTPTSTPDQPAQGGPFFSQGPQVGVRTVAQGMTAPTDFAVPADGSGRQFVTDQTGQVWVVAPEGGRREQPFIDVSDRMVPLGQFWGSYADPNQAYDERGLLGIEFHPDFQNNRRFYLHYSAPPNQNTPQGWDHVEVVSEFTASQDLSTGDPASERKLLQFQHPQYNHDAGPIAFGPDGYLYVPMGDGGGANDEMYGHVDDWYQRNAGGNGQDVVQNMLGDVLRIDVDTQADGKPYGIPQDNPFVGTDGIDEIYAYGFRNPFGISFDSQGNLFVADAGQNLFEEASVVERGGNYGWNVKEGTHCFSTANPSDPSAITDCPNNEPNQAPYDGSPLIDPIVEFPHTYQGQSVGITIIGGHRYEAGAISALQGKYIFGAWTTDPARNVPAGRVLAATPPADFGGGGGAGGTPTSTPTPTGNETATDTPTGTPTGTGNQTGAGTETANGAGNGQVVPRERLWQMEEVRIAGGFEYFVRMFGQGPNGEVYVLANKRGVPEGNTGVVLEIVPPGQGETPTGTPTPTPTPTPTGNETATGTPTGTPTGTGNQSS